jgi:hypothetical protein
MNERIKELMEQAGIQDNPDQEGLEFFAELIVRECADVAGRDVGHFVLKHFEVKEQVTEPNELHTCPYAEEIHGDYETLCDCDEESTRQCAMDV